MNTKAFLKWASHSLLGHIVLSEFGFGLPMFVFGLSANASQGTLTAYWALNIAFLSAIGGLAFALLFWFGVSRHLIKRV